MRAFETEVAPGRMLFGSGRRQWLVMLGVAFGLAGAGSTTTVQAGARSSPGSLAWTWETPEWCTPIPEIIVLAPSCFPQETLPALPNDDAVLVRKSSPASTSDDRHA